MALKGEPFMKVTPMQHNFIDVEIVDVDKSFESEEVSQIYSLPAIPRVGESIRLKEGSYEESITARAMEIVYYAYSPSSPRRTYVTIFVEIIKL
jgi:hypothetical protein